MEKKTEVMSADQFAPPGGAQAYGGPPGGAPPGGAPPGYGPPGGMPPGGAPPGGAPPGCGPPGGMPPGGAPPGDGGMPPGGNPPPGASGYGMQPPPGASGYGMQAPAVAAPGGDKKKPNVALLAGAGVGGLVVIGAIVGGVMMFKGGGGGVLPCDAGQLPDDTKRATRTSYPAQLAGRYLVKAGDVPDEAAWTYFSKQICGAKSDVVADLMSAKQSKYARERLAAALHDTDAMKTSLSCGKSFAGELSGKGMYSIRFGTDKEPHSVMVFLSGMEELKDAPENVEKADDEDNIVGTRCMLEKGQKECTEKSDGFGRVDGTKMWIGGDLDDIRAFGKDFSKDGKNKVDRMDDFVALTKELSKFDDVNLGGPKAFSLPGALDGTGASAYGEDKTKKLEEEAEKADMVWGEGSSGALDAVEGIWVLVASSESEAKDLFDLVEDYQGTCEKQLDKAEKDEKDESDDETPREIRKYFELRKKMARRAFRASKPELDGKRIVWKWSAKVEGDESKVVDELITFRKGQLEVAKKAVASLLEGKEVDRDILKELGGSDLVDAVKDFEPKKDEGDSDSGSDSGSGSATMSDMSTGTSVPGAMGFEVPSGGEHSPLTVGTSTMNVYKYTGHTLDTVLVAVVARGRLSGWTCSFKETMSGGAMMYECRSGASLVRLLLTSPGTNDVRVTVVVPK